MTKTSLSVGDTCQILHPELKVLFSCRVDTISGCGRYVKVILKNAAEFIENDDIAEAAEAAIGEDWNVSVAELS